MGSGWVLVLPFGGMWILYTPTNVTQAQFTIVKKEKSPELVSAIYILG